MGRYERQMQLTGFGREKQEALSQARVLVVGAGGLSMPVLQYLTAMGVGTLGIIENDRVALSNLHRQVLYETRDAGKPKLYAAIAKLSAQNPDVELVPHAAFLRVENALEIIGSYDLVIDGCDNIGTRYLVNDACVMLGKPFIYGAVFQYEGQLSVCNFRGSATYRCLFPQVPGNAAVPGCNETGVLGILPGIIGSYQAAEALKVICGIGSPLANQLLCIDMLTGGQLQIRCRPDPANLQIRELAASYWQYF
ncbi:HesA/MoeB/ThiF family protein [Anseongella ginsenosidimutans]|nr:HesA/MoeB/ThiF family protein [Anseongella ginsenosidimutans]QEC51168.1 HesA/MoeB/ThiF family protein [Anseongella ginsenosidimutans]